MQLRTTVVVYICIERSENGVWCQRYSQDPLRCTNLKEPFFNQKKIVKINKHTPYLISPMPTQSPCTHELLHQLTKMLIGP